MRNGHGARLPRMLELDVAAGLMHLAPPLRFKPADNSRAVHVCNYTQRRLGALSNPWEIGMAQSPLAEKPSARFVSAANLAILAPHGNRGDSDSRFYAALRRADRRGRCHAERGFGAVLRLSGAERGGQVHHQDRK